MVDYFVRAFSIAGIAMPSFWLGILMILGLLIGTQEFMGRPWMPPISFKSIWDDPAHNISQLIWLKHWRRDTAILLSQRA